MQNTDRELKTLKMRVKFLENQLDNQTSLLKKFVVPVQIFLVVFIALLTQLGSERLVSIFAIGVFAGILYFVVDFIIIRVLNRFQK